VKPLASLSLDLDNLWSYMKVHHDPGWEAFPSYLDLAVPRILEVMDDLELRLTVFVVGRDASMECNRGALEQLGGSRHEVGCHSFEHEPWLHRYRREQVEAELERAEQAIRQATGRGVEGFRGPGFSASRTVLEVLRARGYRFDASTLPTYIGPLARTYYFMTARLPPEEKRLRAALFGTVRDGLRPVGAYRWQLAEGGLLEIPVTTFPGVKTPFHLSYILYLSTFSQVLARAYFRAALTACRAARVEPSLLLHPLDFLGGDEVRQLAFFPAMGERGEAKRARVRRYLSDYMDSFRVLPMGEHASALEARPDLPRRAPDFVEGPTLEAPPA
jgi:peptidoglycan/xylan/chitin deacetylase (PgdA/CDA1 family)